MTWTNLSKHGSCRHAAEDIMGEQTIQDLTAAAQPDQHAFVLACAERSEQGTAELLAQTFAGRIVYDHSAGCWHRRTAAGYWAVDRTLNTSNEVPNAIAALYLQAASVESAGGRRERSEAIEKAASSLRRRLIIGNVLDRAKCQPALAITGDRWDCLPCEIACANGIVSLADGALRAPRHDEYIRTHSPAEFTGIDTPAPRWTQFLNEVFGGDAALIEYVQRALGYSLMGTPVERVLMILHGIGANGKTTLLEAVNHVFGHYCYSVTSEVLLESPNQRGDRPQPSLYGLQGKRLVWASETGEGRALAGAQVKLLTGNDSLTVHSKYTRPVTFRPSHSLFLIANHLPRIVGDDQALWDRVHCIPFAQRFVEEPHAANEHPRDPRLLDKLKEEASGILAWAVRGAIQWRANGLTPPAAVVATTSEYRQTEDTVGRFIEEETRHDITAMGDRAGDIYAAYRKWCEVNGHRALSMTRFGQALKMRGITKTADNRGLRYDGLSLVNFI